MCKLFVYIVPSAIEDFAQTSSIFGCWLVYDAVLMA